MLLFKPIDLSLSKSTCIKFREDSFVISFGDAKRFYEADGLGGERYIKWLENEIAQDKKSVVHVCEGDQVIGQIELGRLRENPTQGYVNLYYLIPEKRGQGFGATLDRYAMDYFKSLGLASVRLSVSPTNTRALAYYLKMGWTDLGPRPDHPEVHFMVKMSFI